MTKSNDTSNYPYSKVRKLFWSKDFGAALAVGLAVVLLAPQQVPLYLAREILAITVSVLAIIFSVFFAGVAVIMTAGDNEFITFLQVDKTYTRIVWSYKATLVLLFVALIVSLGFLVVVFAYAEPGTNLAAAAYVPRWLMAVFAVIASWALFAALLAASDAIEYANLRARYIAAINGRSSTAPEHSIKTGNEAEPRETHSVESTDGHDPHD